MSNLVNSTLKSLLLALGGAVGSWTAYSKLAIDHDVLLPPAVDAPRHEFYGKTSTFLSYYADTSADGTPLVLLHSINAAASAYEMKPIFEAYQGQRPVYALELPGYGFSERSNREYTPELFRNAILDFLRDELGASADVVAFSLSSEFAAMAATHAPECFRSLTVISPTGLTPSEKKPGSQSASENDVTDTFYSIFSSFGLPFYDLLVSRPSVRFFLARNFVGEVDEGLVDYGYRTSHQPGARYAPVYFLSGKLFTKHIYEDTYTELNVPALILYDKDPNVSFDMLPNLLDTNPHWRARRIPNTLGLPHFEKLDEVTAAMDTFWGDV